MQPLDALTLHYLAGELDLKLAGGKINKIQQASHHELLLHIWVGGDAVRQKLYINIRPEYAFCALLEDTSFLTFPDKAPNFCMVLRKHLLSARIKRIFTLPDERVLNIAMEHYNELGQQVQVMLSIELMGKNSNIILYDDELKMILGCAHGVSEQMSRQREISVGYPYVPPPRPEKNALRYTSQNEIISVIASAKAQQQDPAEALTTTFMGTGKAIISDLLTYYTEPGKAYAALQNLFNGTCLFPAIRKDYSQFSLLPDHQGEAGWLGMDGVQPMILSFYMTHLREDRLRSRKQALRQILRNQEKKVIKRRQELQRSSPEVIESLKKRGDLLTLANSQHVQSHGHKIEVMDYETGEPIEIELEPTLSLSENAQWYYKRYKKAQAREQMALQQAEQLAQTVDYMKTLETAIALAQHEQDLNAVQEDFESQEWIKADLSHKKKGKAKASLPLSVKSSQGFTIFVGKNNLQNDQIVGKLSKPQDLWLHTHLLPGSHVLIKKEEKQAIPDETLLEAAMLAVYFSQARDSVNVPVVYTEARYVRKIPNSYPGHVTYREEKSLNVTPDSLLIEDLLQSA